MDRYGDDLTEEVIQYLTFEDKVRLECVSKQWKRCVFQKQFAIELCKSVKSRPFALKSLFRLIGNEIRLDYQSLECLLKKCPNIIKVHLGFKRSGASDELSLIGQYCHHISSLTFIRHGIKDLEFGQKYGHKLKELRVVGKNVRIENFLKFCPNLKKISLKDISVLFKEDKEFLPRLECISSDLKINSGNDYKLKILSDKYSQTMKKLLLSLEDLTAKELKRCVDCISRFRNLRNLEMTLCLTKITKPIDESLSLIGQKCNKLLKLELLIDCSVRISDRFFEVFHHFKTIRRLRIMLNRHTVCKVLSGSVECFKHCTELTKLSIVYLEMTEDFLKNIASIVPKLQFLEIVRRREFSDTFIASFHSLKFLKYFHHIFMDEINRNLQGKCWYFGKSLSEVMSSPKGKEVIRVNDNCGFVSTDQQFPDYFH